MARLPRVVLPGHPHHVTQRGNRRQKVFFSEKDFGHYRRLLAESCRHCETACWAYCLMPDHVHRVLVPGIPMDCVQRWQRPIVGTHGTSIFAKAGAVTYAGALPLVSHG